MRVVSVAEMRTLEAQTFAAGVTEAELQQRAAASVAQGVVDSFPAAHRAVALVGPGNNGRDAFIAASRLAERGWSSAVYLTPRHGVTEDELLSFVDQGGSVIWHPPSAAQIALEVALRGSDVAIDGLLGIGGKGPARAPIAEIIEGLNHYRSEHAKPSILSVDVPSGVDADSGAVEGAAVRADVTVVLGGAKQGLLSPEAAAFTGRQVFADIGVVDGPTGAPELITQQAMYGLVPRRPIDAHKGTFGRLLVVAGSDRYLGAAYLTCAAAVRAGAGIVALAAPKWLRDVIAAQLPEIIYIPLPEAGPAGEPKECLRQIIPEINSFDAVAIGPGLSTDGGVGDFVEGILKERAKHEHPVVVDADAINVLGRRPTWPGWIGKNVILTPHAGELRRLTRSEVGPMPWAAAQRFSQMWNVTLVVKGPFTAIAGPSSYRVHPRPNPALATAGTGDVLTGIMGGLLARGLSAEDAAAVAVWTHGEAAARAQSVLGGGLKASDLIEHLPSVLADVTG